MQAEALRFRGLVLPDEVERDVYVVDGKVTFDPVADATLVADKVWMLPGLVDAHCHVGLDVHRAVDRSEQEDQAEADRDAGVLAMRDCGSPADTRWIDERSDLPQIVRCGRHIARPKRHTRDIGLEIEPDELAATIEAEVRRGDGWIKLVGDWIDRDRGELAPLWPKDVLSEGIGRAHQLGARVTAHVFGEDALPDLIDAGIDCIEHGTGLTADLVGSMADRGVALVPTVLNVGRLPDIAAGGERFPAWAEQMRSLHETAKARLMAAYEGGVPIFAGTDAGGGIDHGRIAEEVIAMHEVGMRPMDALAAASWKAREWLGLDPGLSEGSAANFVVYDGQSVDLAAMRTPRCIVLRGRPVGA